MAKLTKQTIAALIVLTVAIVLLSVAPSFGVASAIVIDDENNQFSMEGCTAVYDTGFNEYSAENLPKFSTQYTAQSGKYDYSLYEYIIAVDLGWAGNEMQLKFEYGNQEFNIAISPRDCDYSIQTTAGRGGELQQWYYIDYGRNPVWAKTFLIRFTNENVMICASHRFSFFDKDSIYDYINVAWTPQIIFKKDSSEYAVIKEIFLHNYTFSFDFDYENNINYGEGPQFFEKFTLWQGYVPDLEPPTKEGHTFTGWYYDKECTQPYDGKPITNDTNLYSGWKINQYKVYFNDYDQGYITDVTVNWNTPVKCPSWEECMGGELVGAELKHWEYSDGTPYEGQPITEDTYLFAVIEYQSFTISFDSCGGNSIDPISVRYGTYLSALNLPTPVREEYIFEYWISDATSGGDFLLPVTSDMTLYAVWTPEHYTVTFYVDDEIYSQIQVKAGEALHTIVAVEQIEYIEFENSEVEENSLYKIRINDNAFVWLLSEEALDPSNSSIGSNNTIAGVFQKAFAFMEQHSLYFIIGAVVLGVLIAVVIIVCVIARKKRRGR